MTRLLLTLLAAAVVLAAPAPAPAADSPAAGKDRDAAYAAKAKAILLLDCSPKSECHLTRKAELILTGAKADKVDPAKPGCRDCGTCPPDCGPGKCDPADPTSACFKAKLNPVVVGADGVARPVYSAADLRALGSKKGATPAEDAAIAEEKAAVAKRIVGPSGTTVLADGSIPIPGSKHGLVRTADGEVRPVLSCGPDGCQGTAARPGTCTSGTCVPAVQYPVVPGYTRGPDGVYRPTGLVPAPARR